MKRKEIIAELRGMNVDALQAKAKDLSEELMKLRFRKASGQLEQQQRLGEVKRNLARTKTELAAKRSESVA